MSKTDSTLSKKSLDELGKAGKDSLKNPLMEALRENDKKNLFKSNVVTAFHKTGFHLYDYYFGSIINIHDEHRKVIAQEARVGQAAGVFNLCVGGSGTGKTTLCIQLASNIIRQYKHANVIHIDCEQRMDVTRCETVSKLPSDFFDDSNGDARYVIRSGLVGMDTVQEMIVKTAIAKLKLKKELTIPHGFKDEFGKEVMILEPTVVIIDSITSIMAETYSPDNNRDAKDAENLRGNTEGARDAKSLKGFLKDILPLCKEANIIIYGINHINNNMSMNAFIPVARQQNFLKQDEIIPGGKSMIYYPYNIIKLIAKPGDNFTEEADGFAGHVVMVEPIKSSSNQSGNNSKGVSFTMVFSFKNGFDPLRTIVLYARDRGIIEGNKSRLKFKDDPECVFSFKNLYKDVHEKPIWENIKKYVIPALNDHLSFVDPSELNFDERSMDY